MTNWPVIVTVFVVTTEPKKSSQDQRTEVMCSVVFNCVHEGGSHGTAVGEIESVLVS